MSAIEQAEKAIREATKTREGFKGALGIWRDQCATRVEDAFRKREVELAQEELIKLALLNWTSFRTELTED